MALDLFSPGAYFRAPGGNVENVADQKPVISWAAWSINSDAGPIAGWDRSRMLWTAAAIPNFPWLHCRKIEDVEYLIQIGEQYASPAIGCNIEDVVSDKLSLQQVSGMLLDYWVQKYQKPVHMATLPWVQNSQNWQYMSFAVAALEIFPRLPTAVFPNGYDAKVTQDCIDHAFSEGLTKVTLMLETKPPMDAQIYGQQFNICHSLYTGDDISSNAPSWAVWKAPEPCVKVAEVVPSVPLSEKQFPYTGPCYGPSSLKGPTKGKTEQALKRAQIRLGNLQADLAQIDQVYGQRLEDAMRDWQHQIGLGATGQYGRGSWQALRSARVPSGPHKGEYAMDALALKLVREDAVKMCYPHPASSNSSICQGLHPTAGLTANWAIDFCAPGGTPVVAVEKATIRRLSGRDPALGAEQTIGIFGWSIHYETASGYRYFSTHYGTRSVQEGQIVETGQIIGTVGSWPGDPGRSHTHLGVTSPLGTADAKKRITAVSTAVRV